jgi:predicted nuclease with TOPRIM domain
MSGDEFDGEEFEDEISECSDTCDDEDPGQRLDEIYARQVCRQFQEIRNEIRELRNELKPFLPKITEGYKERMKTLEITENRIKNMMLQLQGVANQLGKQFNQN